ncbi:hypothetical protein [Streptomyces melanogenes]|uniref:hypothetical protein n=1 Tax=Streptomyces melanogenes TaxID=67326 RepID=UPI001E46F603|nr:hypothetical protein [Streptomyces melanogenes]
MMDLTSSASPSVTAVADTGRTYRTAYAPTAAVDITSQGGGRSVPRTRHAEVGGRPRRNTLVSKAMAASAKDAPGSGRTRSA